MHPATRTPSHRRKSERRDILAHILQGILMERLNVNIPAAARSSLRQLAEEGATTEGELARALLLEALARVERTRWLERAARASTPERKARDVQMLEALDRWSSPTPEKQPAPERTTSETRPAPVRPTPVKPTPVKPTPMKPTPMKPTPMKPTPVKRTRRKGA
jgi:hypothetical protein